VITRRTSDALPSRATRRWTLLGAAGAADVELTAEDLAEIERAAADIQVEGERYPAQLLATTGR